MSVFLDNIFLIIVDLPWSLWFRFKQNEEYMNNKL